MYFENTIRFEESQIEPEECRNLAVTYVLVDRETDNEIDPSIYTIDNLPDVQPEIRITVNDKSFVENYTPDAPLELVLKAKVGPSDNPLLE